MAGLLDFLDSPGAAMGLGLLAAGGPTTDPNQSGLGQRLAAAKQFADQSRQMKLREDMLRSQMAENDSQNALRAAQIAKQGQIQSLTSGILGGLVPGGTSMGGGSNVAPGSEGAQSAAAGLRGVPIERIAALKAAGGPDLIEAWKAVNIPTSISAGSYAMTPGQAPTYMADPKTGVGIGPGGVYMLPGADSAQARIAGATAGAQEAAKAGYDLVEVKGADGRTYRVPRSQVVASATGAPTGGRGDPPASSFAMQSDGDTAAAAMREIARMKADLATPGKVPDAASRQMMQAEVDRLSGQLRANPSAQSAPGNVADFSPTEKAKQEAEAERLKATAKADVVRDSEKASKAKSAGAMIAAADRAIELLKQGPTASGVGEQADKAAAWFGMSNKGAEIASKLDIVAGDLVNNVPRMEGPQSDGDRMEYKIQAGRAADRSLPVAQRISAAEEVKRLQNKYASFNGGGQDAGSAPPAAKLKAPPSLSDLQNTALKYGITVEEVKKRLGMQ